MSDGLMRIRTDTGSIAIGFLPGALLDRLVAGERVPLQRHVDRNGLVHPGLVLDFSRGQSSLQRMLAGERICIARVFDESGREVHPHVCLFYRETAEALLAAADELFPGGLLPGAAVELLPSEAI